MLTNSQQRRQFLARIAEPEHTAVLTMELQNGIVGSGALFPALADRVVEVGLLESARQLCRGARAAGARVVHCTKVSRPDGAAQTTNCKVFALNQKLRAVNGSGPVDIGTTGASLGDGLWDPSDFEVSRLRGMTPFTSSPLDQILRNLEIRTVALAGVSLNLGIMGMALSAVDLGYQVIVVRDAVTGVPAHYCEQVLQHALPMLATIVDTADLLARWKS